MAKSKMRLSHLPPDLLNVARQRAVQVALIERELARAIARGSARPSRIAKLEADLAHARAEMRRIVARGISEVRAATTGAAGRPCLQWADIPGRNGNISRPGGALASPVWSIKLPAELKETAAKFGAIVHELSATGVKVVDPARIRVDGSPVGEGPASRSLWLVSRRDEALAAIDGITPMSPVRTMQADRRIPITAAVLLQMVCVEDRSICDVLARHGWRRGAHSKRMAVEMLKDVLSRIYGAWRHERAA